MAIRFASSLNRRQCRMSRNLARAQLHHPANDNRARHVQTTHMQAALRHFAQYGLAAADHARQQAMAASNADDSEMFEWWLEICRALDRRMAHRIEHPARVSS
ncbi:MAG: hypothetical protein WA957_13735 [Alteraurantiacibacter sp.]